MRPQTSNSVFIHQIQYLRHSRLLITTSIINSCSTLDFNKLYRELSYLFIKRSRNDPYDTHILASAQLLDYSQYSITPQLQSQIVPNQFNRAPTLPLLLP